LILSCLTSPTGQAAFQLIILIPSLGWGLDWPVRAFI